MKKTSTFYLPVVLPGIIVIGLVTLWCGLFPEESSRTLDILKNFTFANLSWFYILAVGIFISVLIFVALSSFGSIRLGDDNSEPDYHFLSWVSMLFAAGMGIGLMYFSVAEPISHFANPLYPGDEVSMTKDAMLYTFFHWGIHAWAIYAVVGLVLAYFGFRYKLPLVLRSGLYPLFKNKINGVVGNIVDAFALCSTVFGISTTFGFGIVQLTEGINILNIATPSFKVMFILAFIMVSLSVISSISGVKKGVKILSEINLSIVILLMAAVFILGPSIYILKAFIENIGYYFANIIPLTFKTYAYEPNNQGWFTGWTVIYWAWWISWAPFVGLFIARISRGRTIREFIFGTLIIPSLFNFLWMTVFGNSAIWFDTFKAGGALSAMANNPDMLLFTFFTYLPFTKILSFISIIIVMIFFITSADSGIFVINGIACKGKEKSPAWQKVFWGAVLLALSFSLLRSGGLKALQTMTLITALPFGAIMLLLCAGLLKGLYVDSMYFSKKFHYGSHSWDGSIWKERLQNILKQSKKRDVREYFENIAFPAFNELAAEMAQSGIEVSVNKNNDPFCLEFVIANNQLKDFFYGITVSKHEYSDMLRDEFEHINNSCEYITVTYFKDGRSGYGVQYMTKEELIADIIKQYERFLILAGDASLSLMLNEPGI